MYDRSLFGLHSKANSRWQKYYCHYTVYRIHIVKYNGDSAAVTDVACNFSSCHVVKPCEIQCRESTRDTKRSKVRSVLRGYIIKTLGEFSRARANNSDIYPLARLQRGTVCKFTPQFAFMLALYTRSRAFARCKKRPVVNQLHPGRRHTERAPRTISPRFLRDPGDNNVAL